MSTSPQPQSTAMVNSATRAASLPRAVFFIGSAFLYVCAIFTATLRLNPYFAQTWDVGTFIQAAHRFLDGGNPFDLYAASRAAQTWPYAYPPLHAFVVAAALFVGSSLRILPDYIWARVPVIAADIAVGLALYAIVRRKADDETLARAAMVLWLFNPVTFYETAVQGHFESEWLLFVVLAYAWHEDSGGGATLASSLALAAAVLFKQVAILFAIPLWMVMLVGTPPAEPLRDRLKRLSVSLFLFAFVVAIVCLPYLLYSNDFLYMNLTYVDNVPVQTQSWIVALLGLTRASRDALTSDFVLLRYQTIITLLVAAIIAFFATRRGFSLYLTGTLIALAFFLTSRKVMGYYYLMLFPFFLAYVLPKRRFYLGLIATAATAWISLSPYFAPWSNPDHLWIYAGLGIVNSALFVWVFARLVKIEAGTRREDASRVPVNATSVVLRVPVFVSAGLFGAAALAAALQPLAQNSTSPIRAPIITPGTESIALFAFAALAALVLLALVLIVRSTRGPDPLPRAAWALVLIFVPLFFAVYYLTKESTAILEIALKSLGV